MNGTELSTVEKDVQRILEERARELARLPKRKANQTGEELELLILSVGSELYGVQIECVQEIQIHRGLTPVPGTPVFWPGVINLRGRLVAALDLRTYLGLGGASAAAYNKVVVVSGGPSEDPLTVALLVNEVRGVRRFAKDAIRPPVKERRPAGPDIVTGITADLISVLDVNLMLLDKRLAVGETNG